MAEKDLLTFVKTALSITGDYQNDTLQTYISEVQEFLKDAGVPASVVGSEKAFGVIARGVDDLWNNTSGKTDYSPYFLKRASQLALKGESHE